MATKWGLINKNFAVVLATDWRVPAQATPTTVPASKPSSVAAFSNKESDYTSTTLGTKVLIAFPQTTIAINKKFLINLQGDNVTGVLATQLTLKNATLSGDFNGSVRVRPITASWDPTTITWNGLSGLTFGTAFVDAVFQNNANSLSTAPLAGDTIGTNGGGTVNMVIAGKTTSSPLTMYGVIVETFPQINMVSQAGQPETSQLSWTISSILPPYLVPLP